jgi:hypothetical protein
MIKYEYLRVGAINYAVFHDYGKSGWELVCVDDGWAYFKRVLVEKVPEQK